MKQVQLKIEEFFKNRIVVDVLTLEKVMPLWSKVAQIIHEKIDYSMTLDCGLLGNLHYLKQGESRGTIIEALFQYQKSLLKKEHEFLKLSTGNIIIVNNAVLAESEDFYNPKTRIITITDFEGAV